MSTSPPHLPPKWAEKFFLWYCKESEADMLLGDMYELYEERVEEFGAGRARRRFIWDVITLFRPFAWKNVHFPYLINHIRMYSHYAKVGWRNMLAHKGFSIINILGLALGLACCLLMFLYVQFEWSFDKFHEKSDSVFRVTAIFHTDVGDEPIALTPNIIGPLMTRTYPEVEKSCRIYPSDMLITHKGVSFKENNVLYVDSTFFDIFSFELLRGSPSEVLSQPNSLVISPLIANKYFGEEDPIGKLLYASTDSTAYIIRGIVNKVPRNSNLTFDILIPFHSSSWMSKEEAFFPANYQSYVLLNQPEASSHINPKLPELILAHSDEETAEFLDFQLQPLAEVYLQSTHLEQGWDIRVGDIRYLYLLGGIALLILVIACINYINLTTARSVDRAKEVGLRKVIGAQRSQIFSQFIGETAMVAIFASALALILAYLALPFFNDLTQRSLTLVDLLQPSFFKIFFGILIIASLLAGLYPSLVLSNFQPIRVLRGSFKHSAGGSLLRKGLVISQFVISTCLIVGAIAINKQLEYIQSRKLGFDKEHTLILPVDGRVRKNLTGLKERFAQNPQIVSTTVCTNPPHLIGGGYSFAATKGTNTEEKSVTAMAVDHDFLNTMGLSLVAGNNFLPKHNDGEIYVFLINEKLVASMGWTPEEAIGQEVELHGREGKVQGVIKDFHFASMEEPIGSLVLFNTVEAWTQQQVLAKIVPGDITQQLESIRRTWNDVVFHRPFEYQFLDEEFNKLYDSEQRNRKIANTFAILALFIASLGLFGLASHTTLQRTKEIGIRKIIGASIPGIFFLLSKEYLKLIGIALIFGIPIAYYLGKQWLEGFAYHVSFNWLWILLALGIILLIAIVSITHQTLKAATSDPVDSLKYE